jgi:hypothetical protein
VEEINPGQSSPGCRYIALVLYKTIVNQKFIMNFVVIQRTRYSEEISNSINLGEESIPFYFFFASPPGNNQIQLSGFPEKTINGWKIKPLINPAIVRVLFDNYYCYYNDRLKRKM